MLSTSLLASFFLVATSVQAAPFISSSKALYKRAEPQTADSINKQVHTNSTQVEIQYVPFRFPLAKGGLTSRHCLISLQ
jgi:hypothetical protein